MAFVLRFRDDASEGRAIVPESLHQPGNAPGLPAARRDAGHPLSGRQEALGT